MALTRKEKKQLRDRVREIDVRFGEIATLLTNEKRAMTADEKEERSALLAEKEIAELRLNGEGIPQSQEEISHERAFGEIVTAMIKKRSIPEEYASIVDGGEVVIPVTRDIQDTTSAVNTIPVIIGDIIEPLEKGLILDKIGAKMQTGIFGSWNYPVVAGVEATLEGENVEVSDTVIDITKVTPQPKRVSIKIPVSNRAIDQSAGMILSIVKKQLPLSVARLLNKWAFNKTAISTTLGASGVFVNPTTKKEYDPAIGIKWADAIKLKGEVLATGVQVDGSMCYVCSAVTYAELESTPKESGYGSFIIENGKLNGIPVFVTEYIGEGVLGFGVFSYFLVGQFGEMRMLVDPYTLAGSNITRFVFNADYDQKALRPEAFGTLSPEA